MTSDLYIYGAAGHGRVILDLARSLGTFSRIFFLDEDSSIHGREILGTKVLGPLSLLPGPENEGVSVALGVGMDNPRRLELAEELVLRGHRLPALVHPRACVSPMAVLGPGALVMAMAVVGPGSRVGKACIVNTAAVVDHDCRVEDGVHLAPKASLCGGVSVGRLSLIGAGATVIQSVSIGPRCVIGAGAVVVADILPGVTAVGVPARTLKR